MPISTHLQRKLQETLGAEAADDLLKLLEDMDANRGDFGELRHETERAFARVDAGFARVDARFERVDARFERIDARFESLERSFNERFDTMRAEVHSAIEQGLRDQTRFFFVAWSVILAAIVGLYAR